MIPMAEGKLERSGQRAETAPHAVVPISQPQKLESLLYTINQLNEASEPIGDARSGDWSGSGGAMTAAGGQTQISARDQAIANLPETPVMQQQLQKHIELEIKGLRREVRRSAHRAGRPGNAFRLTRLYARIRRMNMLLLNLFEASVDVVRRLYIRTFIDKQNVL
jgi:hypothetical protein